MIGGLNSITVETPDIWHERILYNGSCGNLAVAADPVLRILWKFGSGCGSCLADPVWNLATAERILSADPDGIWQLFSGS